MEDRIVGPLTLFQFLYLIIGGMIFYIPFKQGNTVLMILLGIPALILGLAFAFLKVQDQPFSKFIVASIGYYLRPRTRIWHKGGDMPTLKINQSHAVKSTASTQPKHFTRDQINNIASRLDQQ